MSEWLIYAIALIACWGLVNVLDTYLIEIKIWENYWDGRESKGVRPSRAVAQMSKGCTALSI